MDWDRLEALIRQSCELRARAAEVCAVSRDRAARVTEERLLAEHRRRERGFGTTSAFERQPRKANRRQRFGPG